MLAPTRARATPSWRALDACSQQCGAPRALAQVHACSAARCRPPNRARLWGRQHTCACRPRRQCGWGHAWCAWLWLPDPSGARQQRGAATLVAARLGGRTGECIVASPTPSSTGWECIWPSSHHNSSHSGICRACGAAEWGCTGSICNRKRPRRARGGKPGPATAAHDAHATPHLFFGPLCELDGAPTPASLRQGLAAHHGARQGLHALSQRH
jgi:hypothetical protein